MKTINVVAAVICDGERIFATQRGYGEWKDYWEFPGGKIEPGETPEEALRREIQEELDTIIDVGERLTTIEYDYPTFHLSMQCFWAAVKEGHLLLKEHEAARWLRRDELYGVNWLPADLAVIESIKDNMVADPAVLTRTGKFISYILRHHPEEIGITLDEHGWADVNALIEGINKTRQYHLTRNMLDEIVRTNNKKRYSYNEDHSLIRANQGHSIPVDVELEEKSPPEVLYHGTGEKYVPSIDKEGLLPKSRLYVHLSSDPETARMVGSRHGRPVIYRVNSRQMAEDGYIFYLSVNQVWLTKTVPVQYLVKTEADD